MREVILQVLQNACVVRLQFACVRACVRLDLRACVRCVLRVSVWDNVLQSQKKYQRMKKQKKESPSNQPIRKTGTRH